jgi:hypothetical protein
MITDIVAEVCLYCGPGAAGWLASVDGELLGDGEAYPGRSLTVAIWQAMTAISDHLGRGIDGHVRIHNPCSGADDPACAFAVVPMYSRPNYSDLRWEGKLVYVIPYDAIMDAAE